MRVLFSFPNAVEVYVAGSFNNWNDKAARMSYLSGGIWELELEGVKALDPYKYVICARDGQKALESRSLC